MSEEYRRRQRAGNWPTRGRWNPDGLPDWYLEMLVGLAGSLTRWRDSHDPAPRLDPRCDPRDRPQRQPTTGGCHACD